MPEPATRERGIMFTDPMVHAILEGRKTQTRRVVKPALRFSESVGFVWKGGAYGITPEGKAFTPTLLAKCPYGQPGDRLWVREGHYRPQAGTSRVVQYLDGKRLWLSAGGLRKYGDDNVTPQLKGVVSDEVIDANRGKKIPSMFMQRWASRITLEITEVRVERVQDISSADALAEGIRRATVAEQEAAGTFLPRADTGWFTYDGGGLHNTTAGAYAELWDSINGKTFPWASDPWVWALTFKRTEAARA